MAAEMWYYTTEGKQMDPVSMKELKRLVGDGTLKPTDMVWKDGMPRWIRASSLTELFPDPTSALDQYFTSTMEAEKKAALAPTGVAPGKSMPAAPTSTKAGGAPTAEEKKKPTSADSEEDGRPPRRRAEPKTGGGGFGMIILMLVGAFCLVTCLFGMVVGAVFMFKPSGEQKPPIVEEKKDKLPPIDGEVKYDVQLAGGQKNKKSFGLKKGVSYDVRVRILEPADPNARATVIVYHSSGAPETKSKTDLQSRNYFIRFTPVEYGTYDVEVENKTAGDMKVALTVRETEAKGDPLPEGVKDGRGSFPTELLKPGKEAIYRFQVKGGYEASFSATCIAPKVGSDINIQVTHENNFNEVYADDLRPEANATVRFTRPETEIVRVRVINASTKVTNRASIIFNVSP